MPEESLDTGARKESATGRNAERSLDREDKAWLADVLAYLGSYPRDFIEEIAPKDRMDNEAVPYLPAGRSALTCVRLAMLESGRHDFESILDFGSGFGRVLRMLKAAFPDARLTAADVRPDVVDFCASVFGASAVYASHDPTEIEIEGPFDLIWCGSLFTHFSAEQWRAFLPFFESLLAPKGLFVFTTLGRLGIERFRSRAGEPGIDQMMRDYDEHGFGFHQYPFPPEIARVRSMGVTISNPSWVCAQIEKLSEVRLVSYHEGAWGRQDVVAVERGPFETSLASDN